MEILIVEDDPSSRSLLTQLLAVRGHRATACETAEEAAEHYKRSFYPLVLLDLFLPGMNGFDFCRWLRAQPDGDRPYILVCTASNHPSDLQQILQAGADDYLTKPYQRELFGVRLAVAEQCLQVRAVRKQLEEELAQEREHLAYLASHDALTKLGNREQFSGALEAAVETAESGGPTGALLYIDLDHFKIINDTLGHAAGDRLLVQIAYLLRNAVRSFDTVARFGSDEFLILQEDISAAEARMIAERVRARVADFVFCDSGKSLQVGVSIGVADISGQSRAEHVLSAADAACYSAKVRGRNRVEVYQSHDPELVELRNHSTWAARVRKALKANAFELHFEPVFEIETNRARFYETSTFLRTSEGETIDPALFMPAAERFHLAPEIDRRTIRLALRHLASDPALRLAISLSEQSLADPGLAEFVRKAFAAAGVEPERVTFEIAESAVVSNLESARAVMDRLGEEGFRFALDDFGAGFSSFAYLKHLSVDFLKIDGGFIRDMIAEPMNLAYVELLNDIARQLQIHSVAERVENVETLKALRKIGVRYAQGRYFNALSLGADWGQRAPIAA